MTGKNFILGVITTLLSTCAYGQMESVQLSIGPSTTSTLRDKDDGHFLSYGPLYNYNISIDTRFKMTTRSGLRAKLIFEDRGSKGTYDFGGVIEGDAPLVRGEPTYKANVKCLTLPILYSFQFGKKIKFSLEIGPHVSYQLNTRMTAYQHDTRVSSYNYRDDEALKFGATLGFGMDIPVTDDLGITVGLLDNFSATSSNPRKHVYTKTFNLSTGVRYKFKHKS